MQVVEIGRAFIVSHGEHRWLVLLSRRFP
jgi:hypothetical protein